MSQDLFGNAIKIDDRDLKPKTHRKKKKPPRGKKGEQCNDCKHCFFHQYNKKLVYCDAQIQMGTAYNRLKIRKTDQKCAKFEQG